jgi:hypothetical protein
MKTYLMYVDETGTVTSNRPRKPYGVGYFIVEANEAERIRRAIADEFPPDPEKRGHRIHMREEADPLATLHRLIPLISDANESWGGAHIFPIPEHLDAVLRDIPTEVGIRYPEKSDAEISAQVYDSTRLYGRFMQIYGAALTVPIVDIAHSQPGTEVAIEVYIGEAGGGYALKWNKMMPHVTKSCESLVAKMVSKGRIPPLSMTIAACPVTATDDSLFCVADVFAYLGNGIAMNTLNPEEATNALDLYRVMEPATRMLKGLDPKFQPYPGITWKPSLSPPA